MCEEVGPNSVLRVGWAWEGFCPTGDIGEGVGDDLVSVGFDGRYIWHGGFRYRVEGCSNPVTKGAWWWVVAYGCVGRLHAWQSYLSDPSLHAVQEPSCLAALIYQRARYLSRLIL